MKRVLRFISRYVYLYLGGRAFGRTLAFDWGNDMRGREVIEVTVTGLTLGFTFGIYV